MSKSFLDKAHSRPLFNLNFFFSKLHLVEKCKMTHWCVSGNRTADLWRLKRSLYQLSHNHCLQSSLKKTVLNRLSKNRRFDVQQLFFSPRQTFLKLSNLRSIYFYDLFGRSMKLVEKKINFYRKRSSNIFLVQAASELMSWRLLSSPWLNGQKVLRACLNLQVLD